MDKEPFMRLMTKFEFAADGCWNWIAAVNDSGYGRLWIQGRYYRAHRLTYELLVGPIPEGLEIDHLCRNRRCLNPAHMEPVTSRENTNRGLSAKGMPKHGGMCRQGHPLIEGNIYARPGDGRRRCVICKRAHAKSYRSRVG